MRRYQGPPQASKASPTTQCQKCLQRGHYTYECKTTVQARPYVSRPSRTQQLFNPKLVPQLHEDVPEELKPINKRKEGVAHEILKKKEEERKRAKEDKRGRRRDGGYDDLDTPREKRRRSRSKSLESVSTISTNASRSRSPPRKRSPSPRRSRNHHRGHTSRRRSPSVERSRSRSRSPYRAPPARDERSTRGSRALDSPPRGRMDSRSVSLLRDVYSRSRSRSPAVKADPGSPIRRAERSVSRSSSMSLSRGDIKPARERSYSGEDIRGREGSRSGGRCDQPPPREASKAPSPPRKRSLSPFSKRVALTKQMGGR